MIIKLTFHETMNTSKDDGAMRRLDKEGGLATKKLRSCQIVLIYVHAGCALREYRGANFKLFSHRLAEMNIMIKLKI